MHGRIIMSDERYLDENKREREREREANISEINEGQVKTNPESVDERLNHLERERDLQLLMACYRNWRATVEFLRIQGGCLEKDNSILITKGPLIRLPHRLCKTSLSSGAVATLTSGRQEEDINIKSQITCPVTQDPTESIAVARKCLVTNRRSRESKRRSPFFTDPKKLSQIWWKSPTRTAATRPKRKEKNEK
jgi:hypothetical protein